MKMRVRDLLVANRVLVTTRNDRPEDRQAVRDAWSKANKPGYTELVIEWYDHSWGGWRIMTAYEASLVLDPRKATG